MKISAHFDSTEFACRNGSLYPAAWIDARLRPLCETLEVIRESAGKPVTILSGFRTEEYNRSIKGARASQHVQGRAADITIAGMKASAVHALVLELYNANKLPLLGGLGAYPGFVHVDVRSGDRLARWEGSRKES